MYYGSVGDMVYHYLHSPTVSVGLGRHVNFACDPLRSYFDEPQKNEIYCLNTNKIATAIITYATQTMHTSIIFRSV